ncbi:MAG: diaminopimelate epimerase [Pseudomonadota bacterium]
MRTTFTKMHGLGNDFVVVDLRDADPASIEAATSAQRIRELADRRTGIGFDQWLTIGRPSGDHLADYRVFNADGGEVEQCGNGARCIAAWLAQATGAAPGAPMTLGSRGGDVTAQVDAAGQVTTTLMAPRFDPADIPLSADAPADHYPLGEIEFAAVSVGNPHCVIYSDDAVASAPLLDIAETVDRSGRFPDGVNVGLAQVTGPDRIDLRVRERGVGETRACGTGAAAAAVIGVRDGRVSGPVRVRLAGGTLVVDWRPSGGGIAISGPAETAYEGYVTL